MKAYQKASGKCALLLLITSSQFTTQSAAFSTATHGARQIQSNRNTFGMASLNSRLHSTSATGDEENGRSAAEEWAKQQNEQVDAEDEQKESDEEGPKKPKYVVVGGGWGGTFLIIFPLSSWQNYKFIRFGNNLTFSTILTIFNLAIVGIEKDGVLRKPSVKVTPIVMSFWSTPFLIQQGYVL